MTMNEMVIYILIGLSAGILGGFFGMGGGFIIVPALVILCGFTQLKAQGTSLAVLLPPVGLLAFLTYYRNGNVDIKVGIILCVTLFIGGLIGAQIVQSVNNDLLRKSYAVLMIMVSIKMLVGK